MRKTESISGVGGDLKDGLASAKLRAPLEKSFKDMSRSTAAGWASLIAEAGELIVAGSNASALTCARQPGNSSRRPFEEDDCARSCGVSSAAGAGSCCWQCPESSLRSTISACATGEQPNRSQLASQTVEYNDPAARAMTTQAEKMVFAARITGIILAAVACGRNGKGNQVTDQHSPRLLTSYKLCAGHAARA